MASSEVAYHRGRTFGPLSATPYCMDSLGYEVCCPKCERALANFNRKRSKSECLDSSKWKGNAMVMSEPRMLRSSNRPLFTNSNTIYRAEVQRNSKLCEQCEDSKNSYTVELEELRRQLRQVGRNHYNPRLSLVSREFNMAGSDNNRSSIRQLRPRRFVLPIKNSDAYDSSSDRSGYTILSQEPHILEPENTRVLRNTTKYYPSNTLTPPSDREPKKSIVKPAPSPVASLPQSPPSPPPSEKRPRPQKKVASLKLKAGRKLKPVQDEEMEMVAATAACSIMSSPDAVMEVEPAPPVSTVMPSQAKAIKPNDSNVHSGLRLSLFSNVPPYIAFCSHDDETRLFPSHASKHLKWKLSPITPVVVRKTILNSGFRLVRKSSEWVGTWGKHMKSLSFRTLKESQKINHFPGTFQIGRKDRLWKNLLKCIMKYGEEEFGFSPRTYVLPGDDKLLRASWERNCGNIKWIVKPPASARGVGIKVVHKWNQIPRKMPLVVQKYLDDPYLINDTKFDLRLYVLVTSFNPLRIYLYDNGLVRFASVKYSANSETLQDRYMHLTNYSINKLSASYTQNEDAEACQGHKWTLKALWSFLETEHKVDVAALQDSIVDVVIKTMICGEHSISQMTRANQQSRYCSYELFGIDILLDSKLKPWLLEVNISPSLHSSSPLDLAVKGPLVRDLFNIVGFHLPDKISAQHQKEFGIGSKTSNILYDKRLYTPLLSNEERDKHAAYCQTRSREDYLHSIAKTLTPDDVRHLVVYEDELTQLGSFIKVFPTTTSHQYFQYFEGPRYYNMLFDAWEFAHHANRSKGFQILEEKCLQGVHLDISQVNFKPTQTSPTPQSEEPSPTAEVVRSTSNISLTCAASLCRGKSNKPRSIRSYVTRRTSRRAT